MFTKLFIDKEKLKRCRELRKKSTPQEIIVWSRLRAKRFKGLKFKRQYSIGKYIVDFINFDKKLIIEIDGWQHKEENQERYDQKRSKFLESLGFRTIRFWNDEVNNNLDGVFLKIEDFLWKPSPSGVPDISPRGREGMQLSKNYDK